MHHDKSAAPTYDAATPPEQLIARIAHLEARLAAATAEAGQYAAALAAAEAGRLRAEEAAASAQRQAGSYQELFDNLSVVAYRALMDSVTPPDYVSPYIEQLLGYTPAEWSSTSGLWLSLIHPEDAPQVLASMDEAGRHETLLAREYRMQHRDGHWIWVREQATPIAGPAGSPPTLVGLLFEITKRKQAEAALRASEERLRTILSGMPIMLDAADDQGNLVVWNAECERVTGYSADEMLGRIGPLRKLYPDQRYYESILAEWARRGGNFRNWELTLTRKDGEQRVVAWSNVSTTLPVPGWSFWAVGVDVTEQRRAEIALRESEERLRLALDAAAMVAWEWDIRTDQTIWIGDPDRTFQISGASGGSLGVLLRQRIPPEDLAPLFQQIAGADPGREIRIDHRYRRDDGTLGWMETYARFVAHDADGPERMVGVSRDISERKRLEHGRMRQVQVQETLNSALRALHSHGHDQIARQRILTTAATLLCEGLAAGHIHLWDRDGAGMFRLIAATDASGALIRGDYRLSVADLPAAARENLLAEPLRVEPIAIPALAQITATDEHYYLLAFHWRSASWGFMAIGVPAPATLSREDLTLAATIGEIMRTTVRRWLAVDALQESERRLRLAIEVARMGTFEINTRTGMTTLSAYYAQLLGLGTTEMTAPLAHSIAKIHPDDRLLAIAIYTKALTQSESNKLIFRVFGADDSVRWIQGISQTLFTPDGEPDRVVGVVIDITEQQIAQAAIEQINADLERRVAERTQELAQANLALRQEIAERARAELALRESQRFLERVLRASPARVSIFDYTTRTIIYSSSSFTTQLGYSVEELEQMGGLYPLAKLIHPDDLSNIPAQVQHQRQMADDEVFEREFRMRHADGSWHWFETRDVVFSRDAQGVPEQILGQVFDITARKQVELALAESLAQRDALNADLQRTSSLLSTIINSLDDGLVLIGADGRVLMINQAVAGICRLSPAQIVGRDWALTCPFRSTQIEQALRDGLAFSGRGHLEIDGSTRLFDVQVLPLPTPDAGLQMVLHLVDVTERLRFEELAIQNERLASTGRLAAVVAHEVNSPLQAIQNFLFLAATDDASERDRHLAMVSDEIDRIGGLIRRLLDLQRPADATVRQIDAGTLIERVLALVRSTLKRHRVQVSQDLIDEPAMVMGRGDHLTQVLLNLLMNALDAMPHGGELGLRLWLSRGGEPPDMVGAQQVLIEVADTGQGIPEAILPRIFEQFFTTKSTGSGLGLAISRQIVEQHGGTIRAANRSPRGAVFTVTLPAADPGRLYPDPPSPSLAR